MLYACKCLLAIYPQIYPLLLPLATTPIDICKKFEQCCVAILIHIDIAKYCHLFGRIFTAKINAISWIVPGHAVLMIMTREIKKWIQIWCWQDQVCLRNPGMDNAGRAVTAVVREWSNCLRPSRNEKIWLEKRTVTTMHTAVLNATDDGDKNEQLLGTFVSQ